MSDFGGSSYAGSPYAGFSDLPGPEQELELPIIDDGGALAPSFTGDKELSLPIILGGGAFPVEVVITTLGVEQVPNVGVVAKLLDRASLNDEGTPLTLSFNRKFRDPISDVGGGSLELPADDPQNADVEYGKVVRFEKDGRKLFSIILNKRDASSVVQGGRARQARTYSGLSLGGILDEAVVYPEYGVGRQPWNRNRWFNYGSPYLDTSAWAMASKKARQGSQTYFWTGAPDGWVDPDANWIWGPDGSSLHAPEGICYFYYKNPTFEKMNAAIFFTGDNEVELMADGAIIGTSSDWQYLRRIDLQLTEGEHTFAAKVTNWPGVKEPSVTPPSSNFVEYTVVTGDTLWGIATRYYHDGRRWPEIYNENAEQIQADAIASGLWDPNDPGHWIFPGQVFTIPGVLGPDLEGAAVGNPAGFLFSLCKVDSAGRVLQVILRSDHNWKVLQNPTQPPGFTPGRVVEILVAEAQARGALLDLQLDFDGNVDSDGESWPTIHDIGFPVGRKYRQVLAEMATSLVDWHMASSSPLLRMWNLAGAGQTRAASLGDANFLNLVHRGGG